MSKNTKGFTAMSDKEVGNALAFVSKAQDTIGDVTALSGKRRAERTSSPGAAPSK